MSEHRYSYSAFSPPAARQTSVALLRNLLDGDHRLITSISTRRALGSWGRRACWAAATAAVLICRRCLRGPVPLVLSLLVACPYHVVHGTAQEEHRGAAHQSAERPA